MSLPSSAFERAPGACPLCTTDGGLLVFRNPRLRVIQASEAGFPAFYRVIWNPHVAEFSDLSAEDQAYCMSAVVAVEKVLRLQLQPDKINLAALGNVVPHLHWHVIARFGWDSHFPAPVWASAQRLASPDKLLALQASCLALGAMMARDLAALPA